MRGNQLFIGMSDPTDHEIIDEIAFSSGFHVEPILVSADQLNAAIERAMEATSPNSTSSMKKDWKTSASMLKRRCREDSASEISC